MVIGREFLVVDELVVRGLCQASETSIVGLKSCHDGCSATLVGVL